MTTEVRITAGERLEVREHTPDTEPNTPAAAA